MAVHACTPTCGHAVIGRMLDEWNTLRLDLAELEREDHPDLVDTEGRTWVWMSGDLYRHEGKAWPKAFIDAHAPLPRS